MPVGTGAFSGALSFGVKSWHLRGGNFAICSFRRSAKILILKQGRVAERFKALVLKTSRGRELPREFESHPFRHMLLKYKLFS